MSYYYWMDLNSKNLHHAYCIVGESQSTLSDLHKFLKNKLDFNIEGNPDFLYGEYDVMDIADVRKLREAHQNRPTVGDKKIFIMTANFITEKAQNAMLKVFEEPSGSTHFFLILPSLANIIPTLKSRMFILENKGDSGSIIDVKNFLKSAVGARLEQIKKLMDSISDEETSKVEVVKFINSLEVELKDKTDFSKDTKFAELFENMEKVRQYATEQSPSLKMILEYLALSIPNV